MSEAGHIQLLELSWINSAVDKSAEAYFDRFELCDKPTAHRRYKLLVDSKCNNLSGTEKMALNDDFEHWKKNKGHQFWLDRRTHLSTMRTAGSLAETAEPYVQESFKRNLSRIESGEGGTFCNPVTYNSFHFGALTIPIRFSRRPGGVLCISECIPVVLIITQHHPCR